MEKRTRDIAPLQRGFDLPSKNVELGFYPVVYSNGILRKHNVYKVKAPGIVTGRSGTIGKVTYVEDNFWPHNTSLWVTNFFDNNPKFIYYFYIRFKLDRYNAGSTVPTLNRNDVHFVKKCIPSLLEQNKISSFLTTIDERIQTQSKILEDYKLLKKGLMQKIFKQELRFKDEHGNIYPEWEEKKLGKVAEIKMGQSPDSKSYNLENEGLPLIQGNADIKNRVSNPRQWTSKPTKTCEIGDLILTVRAPVGAISKSKHNACIGRGVCSVKNNKFSNQEFIYQLLVWYEPKWVSLEQGSTFTAVSGKDIINLKFKIPSSIKEQQKIASTLSAIDQKIELETELSEKFKAQKQYFFQNLFI